MARFSHVVGDRWGAFTEVVEDEALALRLAAGEQVAFRVVEDRWDVEFNTRTIKRAEILDAEFLSARITEEAAKAAFTAGRHLQ